MVDGIGRAGVVPVGPRDLNVSPADVKAGETQVVGGEGPGRVEEFTEFVGDEAVISDAPAGTTVQVVVERVDVRKVLVKDDGLCFDLTDQLCDNPR